MSEHLLQENRSGGAGRKRGVKFLPALAVLVLVGITLYASRAAVQPGLPSQAGGAAQGEDNKETTKAVAAANAFLDKLDAQQRGKVLFPYDSGKKPSWSNLPVTMVPRNGVRLGDLTKAQHAAALDAVAA